MVKCKYYDEESCNKDCTDDWVRCGICKEYLDYVDDECEMNGYTVYSTSKHCCDEEHIEDVFTICPKCFEKIKSLK